MAENSIINSALFKKLENSNDFFSVEDLIKEIHNDLNDDRVLIKDTFRQSMENAENLVEEIKVVNEIPTLPIGNVLGDLPNKFIDNLQTNSTNKINLLNSIQKLQSNSINKTKNTPKSKEKSNFSIDDLIKSGNNNDFGED